jgi:vacuolar-type H+-ATPase subunit F/Vma7
MSHYRKTIKNKMLSNTITKNKVLNDILKELQIMRKQIEKLLLLIPEESLKEYKNKTQIKKSFLKAIKTYPPQ